MRAVTALIPFVRAFQLPLNPEELEVMAYAVLRFANSAEELPVIARAVDELIANHLAAHAQLREGDPALDPQRRWALSLVMLKRLNPRLRLARA